MLITLLLTKAKNKGPLMIVGGLMLALFVLGACARTPGPAAPTSISGAADARLSETEAMDLMEQMDMAQLDALWEAAKGEDDRDDGGDD